MKVSFKIDKDTLYLLNACFGLYRGNDTSHCKNRKDKSDMAMFFEVRSMLAKRWFSHQETTKPLKFTMPYYLANFLLDFVIYQLTNSTGFGVFERNKMELLRNELHQKLI